MPAMVTGAAVRSAPRCAGNRALSASPAHSLRDERVRLYQIEQVFRRTRPELDLICAMATCVTRRACGRFCGRTGRRSSFTRRRTNTCRSWRTERVAGGPQEYPRHEMSREPRPSTGSEVRLHFHRQGGESHERDGREQTARRNGVPGSAMARSTRFSSSFRQRAWLDGKRHSQIPRADPARRSGYRDAYRHPALLHVHPVSRAARAAGRAHGTGRGIFVLDMGESVRIADPRAK